MKIYKLGFFGMGTVASSVVEQLTKNSAQIQERIGASIVPAKVCVRDSSKKRSLAADVPLSSDPAFIFDDPSVNIYVELMGGDGLAKEVFSRACRSGIPIITANKMLLAEHAADVFGMIQKAQNFLGLEAAVCGGIPVVKNILETYAGDSITSITGILNGTSNFILSTMQNQKLDYDAALKKAKDLGFAEDDPTLDVDGFDTAHKLHLLMSFAFNQLFRYKELQIEGIRGIGAEDIDSALELGYVFKLIGHGASVGGGFEGYVRPALVHQSHPFAKIDGSSNAVMVNSEFAGSNIFVGAGAGGHPTSNSVVSDLTDYAGGKAPYLSARINKIAARSFGGSLTHREHSFFISSHIRDEIGALSKLTGILEKHGVSLSKVIQKDKVVAGQPMADLSMITHKVSEEKIKMAIAAIDKIGLPVKNNKYFMML